MEPDDLVGDPNLAIGFGKEILDNLNDLPEIAEEFVSVKETIVFGIVEWIEKNQYVTERQAETLCDVRMKIDRWLERM